MAYRQSKRALFFDSIDHVLSAGGFYAAELFPQELVDANGDVQFGVMGLVGYIADLPEQAMVAGISESDCVQCFQPKQTFDDMLCTKVERTRACCGTYCDIL